jgi:NAD(P)-dependent dehydrogenase (short-subunit alcohol dehydrogenase family)
VAAIRKEFGPIYGLVNNAGIGTSGVLGTMRVADIERTVQLNTVSPIVLTKHVVRAMMVDRGSGGGRIVNISSIVSSTGFSGLAVYGATKASALVGFTKSLAREVGPLGITVNAVAPGFVDTAMTEGLEGAQREQIVRRSPLKPARRDRRCRRRGRVPDERRGAQYHRHGADRRRRQHGVNHNFISPCWIWAKRSPSSGTKPFRDRSNT